MPADMVGVPEMAEGRWRVPVAHLQAYLRLAANDGVESVTAPPFTVFLHRGDGSGRDAYAIPDAPGVDDGGGALTALRGTFRAPEHRLRVGFVAEFAPGLSAMLLAARFVEEGRTELLACTSDALRPPPPPPGLAIVTLDAGSPLADVREGLDANERGFDPQAPPTTDVAAEEFRRGLVDNRAFTARLHGVPAGAGMFTPPHDGVTELVGITTLAPFRRRGVASFLTAQVARTAFGLGNELVFLSTSNPEARRVYERLGFRPYATLVVYGVPQGRHEG